MPIFAQQGLVFKNIHFPATPTGKRRYGASPTPSRSGKLSGRPGWMIKVSSVGQFQAPFNPVQPFPDAVNGVPVLNNFRVIAGFIPGDSGKSGLYAAQT